MKTALKICAAVFSIVGIIFMGIGGAVCYYTGLRWPLIHLGLGAVFVAIAIGMLVYLRRRAAREAQLLETGRRIQANIDDVSLNFSVRVNGRCPGPPDPESLLLQFRFHLVQSHALSGRPYHSAGVHRPGESQTLCGGYRGDLAAEGVNLRFLFCRVFLYLV